KVSDPAKRTMQRTGVGTLIGTPHYMSPEQVKGVAEVDYRTDIWALGVIGFQCVTGQLPFDSEGVGDLLIKITIADLPVPSKIRLGLPGAFGGGLARVRERAPGARSGRARDGAEARPKVVAVPAKGKAPPPPKASTKKAEPTIDAADLVELAPSVPPPARGA